MVRTASAHGQRMEMRLGVFHTAVAVAEGETAHPVPSFNAHAAGSSRGGEPGGRRSCIIAFWKVSTVLLLWYPLRLLRDTDSINNARRPKRSTHHQSTCASPPDRKRINTLSQWLNCAPHNAARRASTQSKACCHHHAIRLHESMPCNK